MDMAQAMEYLTLEGIRLQSIGAARSSVVLSTLLENGDVARMTLSVDVITPQAPAPAPQAPQQSAQQKLNMQSGPQQQQQR